jgi:catabolite repression protein CreC
MKGNKGCISNSPCTAVRWVPSSTTLFLVSHADGTIIVYDKERDDGAFTPQDPASVPPTTEPNDLAPESQKSPSGWNHLDNIFVTIPPWHPVTSGAGLGGAGGKADKEKVAKNPVSHWRVSKRRVVGELSVTCCEISC